MTIIVVTGRIDDIDGVPDVDPDVVGDPLCLDDLDVLE